MLHGISMVPMCVTNNAHLLNIQFPPCLLCSASCSLFKVQLSHQVINISTEFPKHSQPRKILDSHSDVDEWVQSSGIQMPCHSLNIYQYLRAGPLKCHKLFTNQYGIIFQKTQSYTFLITDKMMGIKMSAEISVMASLTRLEKPVNYETLQSWGSHWYPAEKRKFTLCCIYATEVKVDCNAYTMSLRRLQCLGEGRWMK